MTADDQVANHWWRTDSPLIMISAVRTVIVHCRHAARYGTWFANPCHRVPTYVHDLIQPAVPVRPLRSSDAPMLSAARTRTEFARREFSVAAPHTWNSLPSDIRSCHTLHTFKNTSKHTCSDSLNLKPPAPPYPLQDFKALYKCCIIIIIIIINIRGKIVRTILCCIVYNSCAQWYTLTDEQLLKMSVGLGLGFL